MIKVLTIPEFDKSLKKLSRKFHSLKEEYQEFIEKTEKENIQGRLLGNGLNKARLSVKSKGKGKCKSEISKLFPVEIQQGDIVFPFWTDRSWQLFF